MKQFRNWAIIYTGLVLAAFLVLWGKLRAFSVSTGEVDPYTDVELRIYKTVWERVSSGIEAGKEELFIGLVIFCLILLAGGYLLLYIFYRTQIKPIRELEEFATEISKGNLDIPLPIRSGSSSDSFTESFDLMREELKKAKEREIAAEQAKREMVAELSHDLKTPVATIQATCEVLDMIYRRKSGEGNEPDTDGILEKIGYIASKTETINKLVENVFRANLDDMEEVSVNVGEYDSREIERFLEGMKDYGNIILDNDIPECLVYMDRLRMEQVIDNVIGNSYKYAGTDIHVSFSETHVAPSSGEAEQFIVITVKDSGPGVPEDELTLIVEKYYRGKNSTDKQGYGLGLYLVKKYMEKQNGGMDCYNDKGFTVKLYVKKV